MSKRVGDDPFCHMMVGKGEIFEATYAHYVLMQLTSGMIEDLDSLLHSGREITTVYEELTKTLPNDHLDYDNVSYIHCCSYCYNGHALLASSS